ncbi:MAG: GNAT family N-acetyltransferase [Bryobacteraceae bacterium]
MPASLLTPADLQIREITDPTELESLAPEWRSLWERCPHMHCFQRPEWLLPWVRHFYRGENIRTLAFRSSGRLVGLAPLFLHRHHLDFEVRQISFIGAGITDYLDILCEPEFTSAVGDSLLEYLLENRHCWDLCDLQELPPHSAVLTAQLPEGLRHASLPGSICPVATLPESEAAFDESLRGRFKNLRRTLHHIERDPTIQISIAGPTDYSDYLQDLIRLHGERWKERRESGMFANAQIRGFHQDVAPGFAQAGILRAFRMSSENQPVSVWYGFAAHGRYYAYLTGFDPEFARLSPGQALLAYSMKTAIREGVRTYDFLRKTEPFKHRWGGMDTPNGRLLLWHAQSRLPGPDFVEQARAELEPE